MRCEDLKERKLESKKCYVMLLLRNLQIYFKLSWFTLKVNISFSIVIRNFWRWKCNTCWWRSQSNSGLWNNNGWVEIKGLFLKDLYKLSILRLILVLLEDENLVISLKTKTLSSLCKDSHLFASKFFAVINTYCDVNTEKTERFCVCADGNDEWKTIKYLGSILGTEKDINRRNVQSVDACNKYGRFLCNRHTSIKLIIVYPLTH